MGLVAKNVAISGPDLATFHATHAKNTNTQKHKSTYSHKTFIKITHRPPIMRARWQALMGAPPQGNKREQSGTDGTNRDPQGNSGTQKLQGTNNRESTANMRVH